MARSTRARNFLLLLPALACLAVCGCDSKPPRADVAVSNSWLAACVRDLAGEDLAVLCLAEPGSCPGRAALRPSHARALQEGKLLLRFDFQRALDAGLSRAVENGLTIAEIRPGGGMCNPRSYATACRQVGDALVQAGLLDAQSHDRRLQAIDGRMENLHRDVQYRIEQAGLQGKAVLTSPHQADFCRALGLDVVQTFLSGDLASVAGIDGAVQAARKRNVRLVIANKPEGRATADTLAKRLGAKVVVFANFPDPADGMARVDDVILANVDRLIEAAR